MGDRLWMGKPSREREFQGAKVPGSERSGVELSLPGANGLGSENSIIQT